MMKVVLWGEDWKELKTIDSFQIEQFTNCSDDEVNEEEENLESKDEDTLQSNITKYVSSDYFNRYFSLFGHEPSPFNLGIYQTSNKDKNSRQNFDREIDVLRATKYVGVVPLLKKEIDKNEVTDDMPVAKVSSRFHISPTEMIEAVLSGDDYYENPEMLTIHSYSASEWRGLSNEVREDKGKVLFGLVNGIGNINLFRNGEGTETGAVSETDIGIVDAYGVFEIIDFVSKAKKLCKKNLKKQSQRVEENLNCKVKGRILVQKQIKYNVSKGQNQKTYCAYNKMSEDIKENQIIKYALHLCQKNHGIGDALAEDIRFCLNTLRGVPLKKCSTVDFVGLKNNGAFRQYKETLNAAKKVIGRYSIAYSDQMEATHSEDNHSKERTVRLTSGKVLPYFIDMNLLFEYYCRAIFKKAVEEYNLKNQNIYHLQFELESAKKAKRVLFHVTDSYWGKYGQRNDDDIGEENNNIKNLERFFMPIYIPDIVITYTVNGQDDNPKVAAVFDAKYSDVEKQEKRSRTHQIMFYMKALGCEYGGLISPFDMSNTKKRENAEQEKMTLSDFSFCDVISINHKCEEGNPDTGKEGDSMLFYVPLLTDISGLDHPNEKRAFDIYVERVETYLSNIAEGIGKKIKMEQEKQSGYDKILSFVENYLPEKVGGKNARKTFIADLEKKINELKQYNDKTIM